MTDASSQEGSSTFPLDDRPSIDEEDSPLEDEDAFEESLENELFNETLSAGIDEESHHIGRIYVARASSSIETFIYEDGSKKISESNDLTPTWEDQGHWRCHTCGLKIKNKAVAFLHASDQAPELVEHLPPAIRANVAELSNLDEFDAGPSE